MPIGMEVTVREGGTAWLKKIGFWNPSIYHIPIDSIDGLSGIIKDSCLGSIYPDANLVYVDFGFEVLIGINPYFLDTKGGK